QSLGIVCTLGGGNGRALYRQCLGHLESGLRKCFDRFFEKGEELIRDRPIDHPVIEGDREVCAGADGDRVFTVSAGKNLGTLLNGADAEYCYLRLIDDRGS